MAIFTVQQEYRELASTKDAFALRDQYGREVEHMPYPREHAYTHFLVFLQQLQDKGYKLESISAKGNPVATLTK